MKTLHLLRHAKSSWDDISLDDHDRPLSRRGRRAAEALAGYLVADSQDIIWILGSTARRVRETVEPILAVLKPARIVFEHRLYLASSATLLDEIRKVDEGASRVLLVGHNPGLHELALALVEPGSREKLPAITGKFPTGALASLQVSSSWRRLAPGAAKLMTHRSARDLVPPDASGISR